MPEIFEITQDSNPEVWNMLQRPEDKRALCGRCTAELSDRGQDESESELETPPVKEEHHDTWAILLGLEALTEDQQESIVFLFEEIKRVSNQLQEQDLVELKDELLGIQARSQRLLKDDLCQLADDVRDTTLTGLQSLHRRIERLEQQQTPIKVRIVRTMPEWICNIASPVAGLLFLAAFVFMLGAAVSGSKQQKDDASWIAVALGCGAIGSFSIALATSRD